MDKTNKMSIEIMYTKYILQCIEDGWNVRYIPSLQEYKNGIKAMRQAAAKNRKKNRELKQSLRGGNSKDIG